MAASSVASPLCTWLVAACMSVACEKDHPLKSSMFQTPKRLSRWAKRRLQCSNGGVDYFSSGWISSFYGSSIHNLMSSCLAFEPCEAYSSSKGLSSSLAFFGDNGFSLFGSKPSPMNHRQRRMNRAAHSDKNMAVAVKPAAEVTAKKKPLTKQRRVVVTGMGVVTPVGHDLDVFYNNLLEGVSGISEIEAFDCAQFPTRIAGEIKSFSTDGWVAPKLSKRADKFMLYMLTAGKKALADGGVTEDVMSELDKARCGVLIGSAMGGMKVFNDAIEALRISYRKMNPFCVPFATTNMGSAMLAMDLGWMGPNYSISTACATSNFCILNAANHIIRGETDMMLCGGSDAAIIPIGLGGFVACRALSQRNSDPAKASRPWDINRDGFVMGEGAGVLLLEELEHAKRRGANIYAEFLGGSFTCDAYHMTEPHPEGTGVVLCIEKALAQAGVAREDVNYINAHATSTPSGDLKEFQALIRCFGQNPKLRVNSTKSMIGHLLGASGAVEAVATVKAIQTGWVHPNINLENPDQGVDTNLLVGSKKERLDIKVALSNSFGFGGHNSSILFAPYK
ncbi:hypothetical protein AAG906_029379 [Vitis piasezkii]|uniref:beta-ketoacyl-[acyl-carrier-protein] synthase I n=2 Tax=Vitis vinifera TaxID=29760 RepID=F6HXQ7_VITVI|nr:3-oxoacyl-[acyl-carrier-protein] synthase II, chloroplastic [Vitis vinifera]XP_034695799.1 3-oxoacyl-[acyl-carrier-protein] synthase II, chloroplastic-like [Vitis riparia]WJZ94233.1 hypothetical protein VitviT2T_013110 [Vitis vinifera]|eukprot:XP_010654405.1 PREDICTED: 3-oxoacyl-[acyl-carrier-protein] synthase II, chloroplastic [Vitis vinifera]